MAGKKGQKRLHSRERRKEQAKPADDEELALAAAVFGGSAADPDGTNLTAGFGEEGDANDIAIRDLIGGSSSVGDSVADELGDAEGAGLAADNATRAWVDDDDETQVVDLTAVNRLKKLRKSERETEISGTDFTQRLREQHKKLNPGAEWAEASDSGGTRRTQANWAESDEEEEDEQREGPGNEEYDEDVAEEEEDFFGGLSRRVGANLVAVKRSSRLPVDELAVKRMADANMAGRSKCVVQATEFHRNGQLFLTAGFDQLVRLFSIDGETNPLMQQLYIKSMPIHTARFSADGQSVVMAGRRKYYYVYDLQAATIQRVPGIVGREEKSFEKFEISPDGQWIAFLGDAGYIILVSAFTKQWVANLKMEGSVRAVAFSSDSNTLISSGDAGEVFHWDLRTRRCKRRHFNIGMSPTSAIAFSPAGGSSGSFAVGSRSGIVNAYDMSTIEASASAHPPAAATMSNLTTPIDSVRYNHDGQMLAIASREAKDALRMVHVPSYRTFANWPTSRTPLKYVNSIAFSPQSGYFASGNDKGTVLLYSLKHFQAS